MAEQIVGSLGIRVFPVFEEFGEQLRAGLSQFSGLGVGVGVAGSKMSQAGAAQAPMAPLGPMPPPNPLRGPTAVANAEAAMAGAAMASPPPIRSSNPQITGSELDFLIEKGGAWGPGLSAMTHGEAMNVRNRMGVKGSFSPPAGQSFSQGDAEIASAKQQVAAAYQEQSQAVRQQTGLVRGQAALPGAVAMGAATADGSTMLALRSMMIAGGSAGTGWQFRSGTGWTGSAQGQVDDFVEGELVSSYQQRLLPGPGGTGGGGGRRNRWWPFGGRGGGAGGGAAGGAAGGGGGESSSWATRRAIGWGVLGIAEVGQSVEARRRADQVIRSNPDQYAQMEAANAAAEAAAGGFFGSIITTGARLAADAYGPDAGASAYAYAGLGLGATGLIAGAGTYAAVGSALGTAGGALAGTGVGLVAGAGAAYIGRKIHETGVAVNRAESARLVDQIVDPLLVRQRAERVQTSLIGASALERERAELDFADVVRTEEVGRLRTRALATSGSERGALTMTANMMERDTREHGIRARADISLRQRAMDVSGDLAVKSIRQEMSFEPLESQISALQSRMGLVMNEKTGAVEQIGGLTPEKHDFDRMMQLYRASEKKLKADLGFSRGLVNMQQETQAAQLRRSIADPKDTIGIELEGVVGEALVNSAKLYKAFGRDEVTPYGRIDSPGTRELKNAELEVRSIQKRYLDSFRAEQVDKINVMGLIENRRDSENPTTVLSELKQSFDRLEAAITNRLP